MYYLSIKKEHKNYLSVIRHWDNLKAAVDEDCIWIKDFLPEQINAPEIHQIPFKSVYELKEVFLFPVGSLLPSRKLPSALIWRSILNVLPVELPAYNHNYFGVDQQLQMELEASDIEREAYGLCVASEDFKNYIETAPAFRLERLQWVMADDKIIVLGTPVLPVRGMTLWFTDDFLLPTGMKFNYQLLTPTLKYKLNPLGDHFVVFSQDGTFVIIPKNKFKPLTISSVRLTNS